MCAMIFLQEGAAKIRGAAGAEKGWVWERYSTTRLTMGLGERRELPQRGPRRSPGHKRF